MKMSPILTPDGQQVFSAGGDSAYKTFEYRGFVVSLEWVGNHRRSQKCMVIWPATNVLSTNVSSNGMWVIGSRAICEFVGFNGNGKATGGASEHCRRECKEALPILGKDRNDIYAHTALVDVVVKFAPELVMMPAVPPSVRAQHRGKAMWDVVASNKSTGKIVKEGAA